MRVMHGQIYTCLLAALWLRPNICAAPLDDDGHRRPPPPMVSVKVKVANGQSEEWTVDSTSNLETQALEYCGERKARF